MTKRGTRLATTRRGRTVVHAAPWQKLTVVMLERHVGYLDVMGGLIRMRHHKVMSRAEIISGFVEFMEQSDIDFTQFATADAMVEYLVEYFSRNPKSGHLSLLLELSLFDPQRAIDSADHDDVRQKLVVATT